VCTADSKVCDGGAALETLTTSSAVGAAFLSAGYTCDYIRYLSSAVDSRNFGAPCASTQSSAGGCFYGPDVGACDQVPIDGSHRRLCSCQIAPPAPPPTSPPPPSEGADAGLVLGLAIGGGVLLCCVCIGALGLVWWCCTRRVGDYRRQPATG
jgi:hypothetical protein